ncbi:C40 family peptidase [Peptoniphilus sp. KCTC 25270]|uniref:C40 family peptidase n=1 Tax=Peptoniphilus sp. KCTC 25270 TaxID=2897414 RepID=UPI001E4C8DCE|nr:C40 family peptidase [Peptoniphilus sp. KCTC 25270]MCD1147207.1 C40 family peptidase [Peptoniphilus sp. KCTC 25270]
MNQNLKLTVGVAALAVVSFVGLRDTGVFVADHQTTLYSGKALSFAVEEQANIIDYKENGYLVQKGNAKVTVPKNKILLTDGPTQKFKVVSNASIRENGHVVRNLFLDEFVTTVQEKEDSVIVKTADGIQGEVTKAALEAVEGPYITHAYVKEALQLANDNGTLDLAKDQQVNVVSYVDGMFVIMDKAGKTFSIDPNYLNFGENGIKVQARAIAQPEAEVETVEYTVEVPAVDNAKAQNVVNSAYGKIGTPYVWGGTSSSGYDCSGLVYAIYHNELGISLPRTSSAQSGFGTQVSRDNLQAGDLVFFNTTGRGVSHVGIYIGDDTFIHAASGAGQVKTNKLSEKYYNSRFVNATRVL